MVDRAAVVLVAGSAGLPGDTGQAAFGLGRKDYREVG